LAAFSISHLFIKSIIPFQVHFQIFGHRLNSNEDNAICCSGVKSTVIAFLKLLCLAICLCNSFSDSSFVIVCQSLTGLPLIDVNQYQTVGIPAESRYACSLNHSFDLIKLVTSFGMAVWSACLKPNLGSSLNCVQVLLSVQPNILSISVSSQTSNSVIILLKNGDVS